MKKHDIRNTKHGEKHEIRNPKLETNSNPKIKNL